MPFSYFNWGFGVNFTSAINTTLNLPLIFQFFAHEYHRRQFGL